MAISVTHSTVVVVPDDGTSPVGTNEWNDEHTVTGAAESATQIIAGAGLTGGGTLAADRTLDVGAGTGITVNANDVALTVPVAVSSGGTGQTTEAEAVGELIQALTEDTTPDAANDFLAAYDASADTGKKIKISTLSGELVAGNTTEIQYNLAGVFAADANNTWVAATGHTNKKHAAFGNEAVIDAATFAAGDPTNEAADTASAVLLINEYFTGDIGGTFPGGAAYGIQIDTSYKETGNTGNSVLVPLRINTSINSDSTKANFLFLGQNVSVTDYGSGNCDFILGLNFFVTKDGAGNVDVLNGIQGVTQHGGSGTVSGLFGAYLSAISDSGSTTTTLYGLQSEITLNGTITTAYGLNTQVSGNSGTITNMIGLNVEDCSGIGSSISHNIRSRGTDSTNELEGSVLVGSTGTPGRRLHVNETNATTNAVTKVLRLQHQSSGSPANNIGVGLEFQQETSANNHEIIAAIDAVVIDVTGGGEDAAVVISTMAAGAAAAERMRIDNTVGIQRSVREVDSVVTLTDGANVTLNSLLGNVFKLVAGGDRTIDAPTNAPGAGIAQKIIIMHEASGADRTLSLATGAGAFRFGTTVTGLTATTDGTVDYIGCVWNQADSRWDVVSYSKGF